MSQLQAVDVVTINAANIYWRFSTVHVYNSKSVNEIILQFLMKLCTEDDHM